MRFPNLRYGSPAEFEYYATGIDLPTLSRRLRRDERTIKDWLSGKARVPWWVPEIMRLQRMEAVERHRQMGMGELLPRLGVVGADIIEFPPQKQKPPINDQRPSEPSSVQPEAAKLLA